MNTTQAPLVSHVHVADAAVTLAEQAIDTLMSQLGDQAAALAEGEGAPPREAARAAIMLQFRDVFAARLDEIGLAQVDDAVESLKGRGLSFNASLRVLAELTDRSASGVRFAWNRRRR